MAKEISSDAMSEAARAVLYEHATASATHLGSQDPLSTLLELEALAEEQGYSDIHSFIQAHI